MAYCNACNRSFPHGEAYNQHIQNSPAHRSYDTYDCQFCDRDFYSEQSRHQHYSSSHSSRYCVDCKRTFMNENNLMQHLHSRTHVGASIQCPWCKVGFATASGVTIHLESGRCTASGLNRQKLNHMVHQLDRKNIITRPMLTLPGYSNVETFATDRSWNGRAYECYLCNREFTSLNGLNNHIKSPVHEQNLYRCPKISCGREYKLLSGLVQHFESESCGIMRFGVVQSQARGGIQNMVGRMIRDS
ncbi:hypothetical protein L207DRAFT_457845 [Hyaloscypha variabilis F]|uniref:C2H2-type domain-containing protein n=1 Tax=Hyaloscypha variabilis (strain UAMH 11265 / GT02V1 / F) TaxID=1149755 RepID=A0A2J6RS95_HYAVF|nr:hypothetical protein L207DRAFT_457845 [Hyaloscypha variabilis F]